MNPGVVRVLTVVAAVALQAGCLIINTGGNQGSVRLAWSCAENLDCAAAGVRDVQITLTPRSTSGSSLSPTLASCNAGTFTITRVREGDYTLTLDGVNAQNVIEFTATTTVLVVGNSETNVGTINLGRLLGELRVDWQFDVVGGTPSPDCAKAGVTDVQLVVDTLGGQNVFNDVVACVDGPGRIVNIDPGQYTLGMYGLTYFNMVPFPLYSLTGIPLNISQQDVVDLGVQLLAINTANFGNLNVSWVFPMGTTCAGAGVTQVNVAVYRPAATTPEDSFMADCTLGSTIRNTFAPGDWDVVVTAAGAGTTFRGEATQNVAPGQTVAVPVNLTLQ